jgi:hypothetical protein
MKPNKTQLRALLAVYNRDRSVARSYHAFRKTARMACAIDCLMVPWCGMWLGIEPDGYTHS